MPFDPGFGISVPDEPNAFDDTKKEGPIHRWFDINGPGQYWGSLDYLLWTTKNEHVAGALVTQGTTAGKGIPGAPGTTTLFGNSDIDFGELSGGRVSFGFSNDAHTFGVEFSGLMLETGESQFGVTSNTSGNPVLARPFINAINHKQTVSLVSFPGAFAGAVAINASTDLWGAESNLLFNLNSTTNVSVDGILGFRTMQLDERLGIQQTTQVLAGGIIGFNGATVLAPAIVGVSDNFNTHNEFYGGQIGLQADFKQGPFFIFASSKVAMGDNYETSHAAGQTTLITPSRFESVSGGLLAVKGTSGLASRNVFTIVPEENVAIGLEVTKNFRFYAGYTFLYWEDVTRPGTQINFRVNPGAVPSSIAFGTSAGGPQAMPSIVRTDYWAQGLTVGFAFRY
jgi:hypothetical protein